MIELIYTSSSKGVDKGSQGYCTVACSDSMPPMLKLNLESMSDYSWIYPPHDKDFSNNPVNYSFVKVKDGDKWLRVLSRIGINGLDYSGRPNKIAHFIGLEDDDIADSEGLSPTNFISGQGTFIESWEDDSKFLERDFSDLNPELTTPAGSYWEEVVGDSAWASHLVQLYRDSPDSSINIIYDSNVDPLKLIAESTSQLSPDEQWNITFSTYFNGTSLNSTCNWRFILRGSKYHEGLKSAKNLIDLNDLKGQVPEADLVLDDLTMSSTEPGSESQGNFSVSRGENSYKTQAHRNVRERKSSPLLLVAAIVVVLAILFGKDYFIGSAAKEDKNTAGEVVEEENLFSYKVEQKLIPKGDKLEQFGDVLVTIKTDEFLKTLQAHKKISLDIFAIRPEKIETQLVSTKQYKVFDNVISKMFLEKIDDEFIQNKEPLIKLRISKELVIESLSEIDENFIEEFKNNVMKMKVNRVIFEFI